MIELYINPLSTQEQCEDLASAVHAIQDVVDCFHYVLPGLDAGTISLIFDWRIEQRKLFPAIEFPALIASIPRDLRVQYYLMTRNRAVGASDAAVLVTVAVQHAEEHSVAGEISLQGMDPAEIWISFGAHRVCEASMLVVRTDDETVQLRNAHCLNALRAVLPTYEASEKHRTEPYRDQRGRLIAPMPYDEDTAQKLLLTSVVHGRDRWAYDPVKAKYLCFKATRDHVELFHGFVVEATELPAPVLAQMQYDQKVR